MAQAGSGEPRPGIWAKRILVAILLLGLLSLLGWLGAAFVPRWWSHRIGGQVSGSITAGIFLGIVYGFVFTALPLVVLWRGLRRRRRLRVWAVWVAFSLVLALPNLFTLGIVLGSGKAAHAGERTLDVEAPGFRGGSLGGAIAGALVVALFVYVVVSGRRSRIEVRRLREQLRQRRGTPGASAPGA